MKSLSSSLFLAAVLATGLPLRAADNQPVFIYLTARVTDHVNVDIAEDQLHRLLPMLEQCRKAHPEQHISATVFFSGAVSQALNERNSQTHIVDFVRDYLRRGVIEAGYDGADEPTYKVRPTVDLAKAASYQDRWLARQASAEKVLAQGRNPLTGEAIPNAAGGLKEMQEVFGPAAFIRQTELVVPDLYNGVMPELGADSETVQVLRRYAKNVLMDGIPSANPIHVPSYLLWAASFSKQLSPTANTPRELYWRDNILRCSEASGADNRLFPSDSGLDTFKDMISKLDRSNIRIVQIELAAERVYFKPGWGPAPGYTPLRYAYENPINPKVKEEARLPEATVKAAYENELALLDWISGELAGKGAGSRFVSNADLRRMTPDSTGFQVSVAKLQPALSDALTSWRTQPAPPKYLQAGDRYLSLADTFQVMTDALAGLDKSGKLPEFVRVVPVYGPMETSLKRGTVTGEVAVAAVARTCSQLSGPLHDARDSGFPQNSIPASIKVGDLEITSSQFLRLMAEALQSPDPSTKLTVKPSDAFWSKDAYYFRTRSVRDMGSAWTLKPAPVAY